MSKDFYCGFSGAIDPNSVQRIAAAFNHAVNQKFSEIYCCFSSNGGTVSDGLFLHNHIRGLPISTTVHNTGVVASVAAMIYIAADQRWCTKYGSFLLHPTTIPTNPDMAAESLKNALDAALAADQCTHDILRDRARIPDNILERRRFTDVIITPKQALEFGIVHRIDEFSLPNGIEIFQI